MRVKEFLSESIDDIASNIEKTLGLKRLALLERGNDIYIYAIVVGKENQGKGTGSKAMKMILDYADQVKKRIVLEPATKNQSNGTTSRSRLVKFYKRFGFKENKGRYIDFALGAGKMYRDPK